MTTITFEFSDKKFAKLQLSEDYATYEYFKLIDIININPNIGKYIEDNFKP